MIRTILHWLGVLGIVRGLARERKGVNENSVLPGCGSIAIIKKRRIRDLSGIKCSLAMARI
ncbi:MAG: hypothetical protein N2595_00870 [bacterium]|nr:hypothetical protein [bacterium]